MKKVTALLSAVFALALLVAPVSADTVDAEISDNGSSARSRIEAMRSRMTSYKQVSNFEAVNDVVVESNTGGNDANRNTGGDVSVSTGDVDTTVTILNHGSSNELLADDCGCEEDDVDVLISNNGERSRNYVKIKNRTRNERTQRSNFTPLNLLGMYGDTGYNRANSNTGSDSMVDVETGDVMTDVYIENMGGSNVQ